MINKNKVNRYLNAFDIEVHDDFKRDVFRTLNTMVQKYRKVFKAKHGVRPHDGHIVKALLERDIRYHINKYVISGRYGAEPILVKIDAEHFSDELEYDIATRRDTRKTLVTVLYDDDASAPAYICSIKNNRTVTKYLEQPIEEALMDEAGIEKRYCWLNVEKIHEVQDNGKLAYLRLTGDMSNFNVGERSLLVMVATIECSGCKRTLAHYEYSIEPRGKYGLKTICNQCRTRFSKMSGLDFK